MKINIGPYPDGDEEREVDIIIDDYDTWSMDDTLAMIILPMLKQLKKTKHGSPHVDIADVPDHLKPHGWSRNESKQLDLFADDEYDSLCWNIVHDRWDWVMGEMIWAFEQKLEDWEDQFYSGEHDTFLQPLDKDHNPIGEPKRFGEKDDLEDVEFYEMVKGPNDTFKIDWDGRLKHQERMSNGFKLFGKYFEGLWD